MRKKLDYQTRNDLQMSHVIAIYLVFKKLSGQKQKKYFCFKTLKLLTLQFQFRKILGGQEPALQSSPFPPSPATSAMKNISLIFIPSRTFNFYPILMS